MYVCSVSAGDTSGRPLLCPALDKFLEVCKILVYILLLSFIVLFWLHFLLDKFIEVCKIFVYILLLCFIVLFRFQFLCVLIVSCW